MLLQTCWCAFTCATSITSLSQSSRASFPICHRVVLHICPDCIKCGSPTKGARSGDRDSHNGLACEGTESAFHRSSEVSTLRTAKVSHSRKWCTVVACQDGALESIELPKLLQTLLMSLNKITGPRLCLDPRKGANCWPMRTLVLTTDSAPHPTTCSLQSATTEGTDLGD